MLYAPTKDIHLSIELLHQTTSSATVIHPRKMPKCTHFTTACMQQPPNPKRAQAVLGGQGAALHLIRLAEANDLFTSQRRQLLM